jgi:hypothetical protein
MLEMKLMTSNRRKACQILQKHFKNYLAKAKALIIISDYQKWMEGICVLYI